MIFLKNLLLLLTLFYISPLKAQKHYKALFIGNSYTYYNDLPQTISQLATSTGDTLTTASSTPGGYTLEQHFSNAATLALIQQGGWDYVVLQEQSQLPAFPEAQVAAATYPFARKLDSLIKATDSCTKTIFYMTWGRKNGDAMNCPNFPILCTYEGMDSLLQLRYTFLADTNHALLAPVAKVWHYLKNTQSGVNLYDLDDSHPSVSGTYAAACAFYSIMFKKDPANCSFAPAISVADAVLIRAAASTLVFDSLENYTKYQPFPTASFTPTITNNSVSFQNQSLNSNSFIWYFGNGDSSNIASPTQIYTQSGTFIVTLVAEKCGDEDTFTQTIIILPTRISEIERSSEIKIYPIPAKDQLFLEASFNFTPLSIMDYTGREILHIETSNLKSHQINVAPLGLGGYFLKISVGDHTRVLKFVK